MADLSDNSKHNSPPRTKNVSHSNTSPTHFTSNGKNENLLETPSSLRRKSETFVSSLPKPLSPTVTSTSAATTLSGY